MKIANIIGARPQFVKYAPVAEALQRHGVQDVLLHTGQHYDYAMSKVFFDQLKIREPDYHLNAGSGSHGAQTALILQKTEEVLLNERPDAVMVYGDTNSTIGGALAAAKLHIPVVHVEAGLRSFNKRMPEEINRILTDHISTLLLCPSSVGIANLRREGFVAVANEGALIPEGTFAPPGSIDADHPLVVNTGDLMYDVLLRSVEIAERESDALGRFQLAPGTYGLMTLHRAENTDDAEQFAAMISYVNGIAARTPLIFPMHPRTRKMYSSIPAKFSDAVTIVEPLSYFDLLHMLKHASLLLTDSGGMQKEAYWLRVPCVTMREETEWTETVEAGWNILYRDYEGGHPRKDDAAGVYGDGQAADRIAAVVASLASL